jgi:hypothetical protein
VGLLAFLGWVAGFHCDCTSTLSQLFWGWLAWLDWLAWLALWVFGGVGRFGCLSLNRWLVAWAQLLVSARLGGIFFFDLRGLG